MLSFAHCPEKRVGDKVSEDVNYFQGPKGSTKGWKVPLHSQAWALAVWELVRNVYSMLDHEVPEI